MKERAAHSTLQNRILFFLESSKVGSLTELANKLEAHRPSVSRAIHALKDLGLVLQEGREWQLTAEGEKELDALRAHLPEQAEKVAKAVSRVVKQGTLASLKPLDHFLSREAAIEAQDLRKWYAEEPLFKSVHQIASAAAGLDSVFTTSHLIRPLLDTLDTAIRVDAIAASIEALQHLQPVKLVDVSVPSWTEGLKPFDATALSRDAIMAIKDSANHFRINANVPNLLTTMPDGPSLSILESASTAAGEGIANRFKSLMEETSNACLVRNWETLLALDDVAGRFRIAAGIGELTKPFVDGSLVNVQEAVRIFAGIGDSDRVSSSLLDTAANAISASSVNPSFMEILAGQTRPVFELPSPAVQGIVSELTREAMSSLTQSQRLSLASIEHFSMAQGNRSSLFGDLSQANIDISRMIGDVSDIYKWDSRQHVIVPDMTVQFSDLAAVTRTYKGYLAESIGNYRSESPSWMDITIPTRTTSAYVESVHAGLGLSRGNDRGDTSNLMRRPEQFDDTFARSGRNFLRMWKGCWTTLQSDSEDRISQVAHSARELLMQLLAYYAPDSAFTQAEIKQYGHDGKATRKMRVRKILTGDSKTALSWADTTAKAIDEAYGNFTMASHFREIEPAYTELQMAALLHSLAGLLVFVVGPGNAH